MNEPSSGPERDHVDPLDSDGPSASPVAEDRQSDLTAGSSTKREFLQGRLQSLDAYRGLIMVTLAFGGFGLAATAANHLQGEPDSQWWKTIQYQFSHTEWVGCSYWDLIQPSFMFMVGVSMAYSYVKRREAGQSYPRMFGHALWRSVVLVFLGIFLISNWDSSTNWSLMNVLTQIGLGYWILFLFWGRSLRTQAIAAGAILMATWLLYVLYPSSGIDVTSGAPEVGVTSEWSQRYLADVGRSWHKNANVGHAVDVWLLNRLPQRETFTFNAGGYQTINFIPSLATMIFGLMCGELLRSTRRPMQKVMVLVVAAAGGLAVGQILHWTGICPLVKRIWTPSWAIFSTGWCCLLLAGLYLVMDVLRLRRLAFPLIVVGVNSIAMYCMGMLLRPWTARTLKTHLGDDIFGLQVRIGQQTYSLVDANLHPAVGLYEPTITAVAVGLVFWLACLWMYRRKIFVRI